MECGVFIFWKRRGLDQHGCPYAGYTEIVVDASHCLSPELHDERGKTETLGRRKETIIDQ